MAFRSAGWSPPGARNSTAVSTGAFASCGLVGGAPPSYDPLLDRRLVYQYYCRNPPRPEERQYDLFLGLDPQGAMTAAEVHSRVNECTGITLPAAQRPAEQSQNLANIVSAARIPESALLANLDAATVLLRILVQDVLGGRNPLQTMGVRYSGSTDDDALNIGVARYTANAQSAATFSSADNPTGKVSIHVVTLHAIDDPRAFSRTRPRTGRPSRKPGTLGMLYQACTNQGGHCLFTAAESLAMFEVLLKWIDTRTPLTNQDVLSACDGYRTELGGACRFNATYQPAPLETRMYPRQP